MTQGDPKSRALRAVGAVYRNRLHYLVTWAPGTASPFSRNGMRADS